MSEVQKLLLDYVTGVRFPDVSGFEILDLLDTRSELALRESELSEEQRQGLEEADSTFLRHAPAFRASLAEVGDISDLRRRAGASCSHWWWYLEKLAEREPVGA